MLKFEYQVRYTVQTEYHEIIDREREDQCNCFRALLLFRWTKRDRRLLHLQQLHKVHMYTGYLSEIETIYSTYELTTL